MKRPVPSPSPSAARGFTLIETMSANAILAVGLAGVLASVGTMARTYNHFEAETEAIGVADSFIEDLVLAPRSSPDLVAGSYTRIVDEVGNVDASGRFTINWVVEGGKPIAGMRRITVDVNWSEDGVPRRVRFLTQRE